MPFQPSRQRKHRVPSFTLDHCWFICVTSAIVLVSSSSIEQVCAVSAIKMRLNIRTVKPLKKIKKSNQKIKNLKLLYRDQVAKNQ